VSFTDQFSDQEILASTIWGEARGEPELGRAAIACVTVARAAKPGWWGGPDIRSVCSKPFQFSCWNPNDPNYPQLLNMPANDPIYPDCLDIASEAMAGLLNDCTNGATSYYAKSMPRPPVWTDGLKPCAEIGSHLFFRI
jgi:N-acetylmuramoyl-L-alanine amidase